jgi:hypothetical protein
VIDFLAKINVYGDLGAAGRQFLFFADELNASGEGEGLLNDRNEYISNRRNE